MPQPIAPKPSSPKAAAVPVTFTNPSVVLQPQPTPKPDPVSTLPQPTKETLTPAVHPPLPTPMEVDSNPLPPNLNLPPLYPPPGFPVPQVILPQDVQLPKPIPTGMADLPPIHTLQPLHTHRPMPNPSPIFPTPLPPPLPILTQPLPSYDPLHNVTVPSSFVAREASCFDGRVSGQFPDTWGLRAEFFNSKEFITSGRTLYDSAVTSAMGLLVDGSRPDACGCCRFFYDLILLIEKFYTSQAKELKGVFDSIIRPQKGKSTQNAERTDLSKPDVGILRKQMRSNQCAISVRRNLIKNSLRNLTCDKVHQYTGYDLLQVLRELSYLTFMHRNVVPAQTRP